MNKNDTGWIQTYTGKKFYPLDPDVDQICIEDIAHALSMICRYGGHPDRFYSVAEHSVLVSQCVPPQDALEGLMHDAREAYGMCGLGGDILGPLKQEIPLIIRNVFRHINEPIEQAICTKFGLTEVKPPTVADADLRILVDEQQALLPNRPEMWAGFPPDGKPLGANIIAYSPFLAEIKFKARFDQLIAIRKKWTIGDPGFSGKIVTYWIIGQPEDREFLKSLGVILGEYDEWNTVYRNCFIKDFSKLQPYWGANYWGPEIDEVDPVFNFTEETDGPWAANWRERFGYTMEQGGK